MNTLETAYALLQRCENTRSHLAAGFSRGQALGEAARDLLQRAGLFRRDHLGAPRGARVPAVPELLGVRPRGQGQGQLEKDCARWKTRVHSVLRLLHGTTYL